MTVRVPNGPPGQVLLTPSVGVQGAQSPVSRGAFCFCPLTDDPLATHPRNSSQTSFRLRTS